MRDGSGTTPGTSGNRGFHCCVGIWNRGDRVRVQLRDPKWVSRSWGRGFAAVSRIFAGQSVDVGQFRQSSKYRSTRPVIRNQSPPCSPNANGRYQRHAASAVRVILRKPGFTRMARSDNGNCPDRHRRVHPDLAGPMLPAFLTVVVGPPLAGTRGAPVGVAVIGFLPKGGPLGAVGPQGIGWDVCLLPTMDAAVGAANPTVGRKSPARWLEPLFRRSRRSGLGDLLVEGVRTPMTGVRTHRRPGGQDDSSRGGR